MTLTADELRNVVQELHDLWELHGQPGPLHQPAARRDRKFTGADVARITATYGFARHVNETSRAICLLLDANLPNQAIPLVRLAYENALTAAWLVQSKDDHGIRALLHEHARGRVALRKNALESASETFREGAAEIADADPEPFAGSRDSLRQFHRVCMDLAPAGPDAYIYYRILSSYSHASVRVSDLYFAPAQDGESVPPYVASPESALPVATLVFFTAASMVWSQRAYSYLSRIRDHRSALRQLARALGINSELQLSQRYYQRHARRPDGARDA